MTKYEQWYRRIQELVGMDLAEWLNPDNDDDEFWYVRRTADGERFTKPRDRSKEGSPAMMDLNIDRLIPGMKRARISLAHNYIQNGDVMVDPDVEVLVDLERGIAFPLTFQQDGFPPLYYVIYEMDDTGLQPLTVKPKMRKGIESFFGMWLRNMRDTGYMGGEKHETNQNQAATSE